MKSFDYQKKIRVEVKKKFILEDFFREGLVGWVGNENGIS